MLKTRLLIPVAVSMAVVAALPVAGQVPSQAPNVTNAGTTAGPAAGTAAGTTTAPGKAKPAPHSSYRPDRFAGRADKYYELVWGIDSLSVKLVESGDLVRFSYRVLDPAKAGVLNDKQNEATLIDPRAGVSLVVPTMEKVGQLRQSVTPQAGRAYWMAFSNKGRPVVRGDRVDVVIGRFKASNLVVD
jgi:hypothetical protein